MVQRGEILNITLQSAVSPIVLKQQRNQGQDRGGFVILPKPLLYPPLAKYARRKGEAWCGEVIPPTKYMDS
jgi:hypothetical protein